MRLAITPGEPAGIGPDLTIAIAQQAQSYELVAICDPELLEQRASALGLALNIIPFNASAPHRKSAEGEISVLESHLKAPVTPGKLDTANAAYVLNTLDLAIAGCKEGELRRDDHWPCSKVRD